MRFLHLADLHLGKSLHGLSLLDSGDQPAWVERFLALAEELKPDAVLIAGDVYDRSAPSGEAVELLSRLLTELAALQIPVLLVAGNHDSAQRLSFASELLARQGLHIGRVPGPGGALEQVTLEDEYGPVSFWLMPYMFPALVAQALGEDTPRDTDGAIRALLERQALDPGRRNVLLAHQNVTAGGAEGPRGGSETMVGGVGQVDYRAFDAFDYVALGHIHAAYPVGRDSVRYAGSPLCYHFDELRQKAKGPLLVELGPKGTPPRVEAQIIPPLHPLRELRGPYAALRDGLLQEDSRGEYWRVVLTDRHVTPEAAAFFRELSQARDSVLMEICSDYHPLGAAGGGDRLAAGREQSLEELFAAFYAERMGGQEPSDKDAALLELAAERQRRADSRLPDRADAQALLDFLTEQEGQP